MINAGSGEEIDGKNFGNPGQKVVYDRKRERERTRRLIFCGLPPRRLVAPKKALHLTFFPLYSGRMYNVRGGRIPLVYYQSTAAGLHYYTAVYVYGDLCNMYVCIYIYVGTFKEGCIKDKKKKKEKDGVFNAHTTLGTYGVPRGDEERSSFRHHCRRHHRCCLAPIGPGIFLFP